jgi:hypothetical protein
MKQIINGKTYNTETATKIAGAEYNGSTSDFGYWCEFLYKSPKGTFFVHGEGGPATRWSKSIGNNGRAGGDGIEVLTESEALEWCENHRINPDIIEAHFTLEEG